MRHPDINYFQPKDADQCRRLLDLVDVDLFPEEWNHESQTIDSELVVFWMDDWGELGFYVLGDGLDA